MHFDDLDTTNPHGAEESHEHVAIVRKQGTVAEASAPPGLPVEKCRARLF